MELELGGVFVREVVSLWRESFSVQFVLPAELLLCARHRKSEFIVRGPPPLTMEMMAAAGSGGQSPKVGTDVWFGPDVSESPKLHEQKRKLFVVMSKFRSGEQTTASWRHSRR